MSDTVPKNESLSTKASLWPIVSTQVSGRLHVLGRIMNMVPGQRFGTPDEVIPPVPFIHLTTVSGSYDGLLSFDETVKIGKTKFPETWSALAPVFERAAASGELTPDKIFGAGVAKA